MINILYSIPEILVGVVAVAVIIKTLYYKGKYSASWKIMIFGFILFILSQILRITTLPYLQILKHSLGIVASITIMFGVWRYYFRIFIYHKKKEHIKNKKIGFVVLSLIILELVIITILPQVIFSKEVMILKYMAFLEIFFWIIIGIFGMIYVLDIKTRLPKLFMLYFLHIKKTTDVLTWTFPVILLWNGVELAFQYTDMQIFYNLSTIILKPAFGLCMILVINHSLETKIIRERERQSKDEGDELLKIKNVMIKDPASCSKDITIREAADIMAKKKVGSLLVTEGENLLGIITERDYVKYLPQGIPYSEKVSQIMTKNLITIEPEHDIQDAINIMQTKNIKRLPVVSDGKLMGIITQTGLLSIMNSFAFEVGKIMEKHKLMNVVDEDNTYAMSVGDIMVKDVVTTGPNELVINALSTMAEKNIGSVVITRDKKIEGIFTEHDLTSKIVSKGDNTHNKTISHFATKDVVTISENTSIFEASEMMKNGGFKRLPVSRNGELTGIISQGRLLSAMNKLASRIVSLKITKKQKYFLKTGESYLIKEENPDTAFDVFTDQIKSGIEGICISRTISSKLEKEFNLYDRPIIWLTEQDAENAIKPTQLEKLSYTITRFLDNIESGIIIIDGVEYLINYTSFNEVLHFLQNIKDTVALHESNLIMPVNPKALDEKELGLLERSFETFDNRQHI